MSTYSNVSMSVQGIEPVPVERLNLEELIGKRASTDSEARSKEKHLRVMAARRIALQALSKAHPDHYKMLYRQAREQQEELRGPLPE